MLEFAIRRCRFSARKRGFFAIACCRPFIDALPDRYRRALTTLEQYLDRFFLGKPNRRTKPYLSAMSVPPGNTWESDAMWAVCKAVDLGPDDKLTHGLMKTVSLYAARAVAKRPAPTGAEGKRASSRKTEEKQHRAVLRDLVVPFKRVVDPAWVSWNDRTVERMTRMIYQDGDWESLPILADALEEAGCREKSILQHRRGGGSHVRGCWAIDLLLGNR
jgi:hypothetical protein